MVPLCVPITPSRLTMFDSQLSIALLILLLLGTLLRIILKSQYHGVIISYLTIVPTLNDVPSWIIFPPSEGDL